jgi:tetratricopeptide (TPR) repeat protein
LSRIRLVPKQTNKHNSDAARLPAAARVLVAFVAAGALLWLAWATLRTGASRMISDYSVRASAEGAADAAINLTPADPEGYYARAGLLADAGDYGGAAEAYLAAERLRPRDYVIRVERGKALEASGDAAGALAEFGEAVRLAPFYAQPRWQLGNALLRAGRRDEAVAELRRAADSDPNLYANFVQTLWYAENKDAGALAREARPRTPEQALAVAKFLIKAGEPADGVRLLRDSGVRLQEESVRSLVKELIAAEDFADAYDLWSGGRASGRGPVDDGGFEGEARTDEEGFGWRFARDNAAIKLSLDSDSPREGARSLRVEFAGASDPSTPAVSQLVVVEPGARYRLSFSARARDLVTGGLPFVAVSAATKNGGQLAASPDITPAATGWRDYAVEFTAPAGVGAVRVALVRHACTSSPCPAFGSLWLDSFALKKL